MSRGGFQSRREAARPTPSPRPADWTAALDLAERLARTAEDEARVGDAPMLVQFRLMVRDLTAESFPVPAPVARLVAGAFLNTARAFAHIDAAPETRTACADLLLKAARLTDRLWTAQRTAYAQATWGRGQFGDRDE